MASRFWKFINGINLVPKTVSTATEKGDLEVVNGRLQYLDTDSGSPSPVLTENSTDTLTNKTLLDPDITVITHPIKFQDPLGTKKISVEAPPGLVPNDFTFNLPPDMGTMDYVLRTDGSSSTSWTPAGSSTIPTGIVFPFAGPESAVPAGWLICGGQAVSRVTYVNLFTLFGTTYGVGDGSTTFNLPDLRGRAPVGKDDMGGTAANRITNAGSGIVGTNLGASGGTQTHALITSELAAHTHASGTLTNATSSVTGSITASPSSVTGSITASPSSVAGTVTASASSVSGTVGGSDGGHGHAIPFSDGTSGNGAEDTNDAGGTLGTLASTLGTHGHGFSLTAAAQSIIHSLTAAAQVIGSSLTAAAQVIGSSLTAAAQVISGSTASTGSGTAHQNTQPSLILNYIIKS